MLICFGLGWPVNIYKSLQAKTAKGKSLPFLIVVFVGYISGVLNKLLYNQDIVLYLYILNLIMVGIDILLTLRNMKLDKERDAAARPSN